ncbi:LytR/AlgR family response regulator transcription factor [Sediminibacillus albus]|uniref:Two-component system, LytT family, response regulator LytT n=1 Tax=Sediminibacillus albus TaxID=407036 RepID=A0A1G9A3A8_9BACI|nr:LytTR family DNA-binding domain-containing protein [Sediminibacillus albus]SDK21842.1 two-component system, LytT family, response regulator LytT [Sediminibacillus albus]
MRTKKVNILLIDDDMHVLEYIKDFLKYSKDIEVIEAVNTGRNVGTILENQDVNAVMLDIEMPDINGLEVAQFISDNYPDIKIIFMSGHHHYAIEGYQYYPFDFITKPINPLRLNKTLLKLTGHGATESTSVKKENVRIGIKVRQGLILVNINEVSYIEKVSRKTHIFLRNGEHIETTENLRILENKLRPHGFYRPHQSYLVPLNNIRGILPDEFMKSYNLLLKDTNTKIKVSKHKYKNLKEAILNNFETHLIE